MAVGISMSRPLPEQITAGAWWIRVVTTPACGLEINQYSSFEIRFGGIKLLAFYRPFSASVLKSAVK